MLELVKKEIEGFEYQFEQWGSTRSTEIFIELFKKVGPAVATLIGEISKAPTKEEAKKLSTSAIAAAVNALIMNVGDPKETTALIKKFVADDKCLCDGKKIHFDSHYQNRLFHMGQVLMAAVEVQYGNFFVSVAELLAFSPAPTIPENPA